MFFEVNLIIGLVFLWIIGLVLSQSFFMVNQAEMIVVERLGKYSRILGPGLHIVIPFIDKPHTCTWSYVKHDHGRYYRFVQIIKRIDLRESVYDFPKQNVITKDNVNIEINALLYYQITDPKAAVYHVINLPEAIEKLTQTTLRNVIGSLDLDETLISRDQINEKLQVILDEAASRWGVKVNRVELQEVNPPRDIQIAMEKQMRAERDRRAIILESEGEKRAAILKAEGAQESAILDAQGQQESDILRAKGIAQSLLIEAEAQAKARFMIAQAEAQAIELVQKSVPGKDPLPYMVAREYIKTLPEITKDKEGKMIIVPYEASSLVGSLSTIKEIFQNNK